MGRTIDFEKIQLTDDIMFSSVLGNPEHCQEFLERILGFKIKELHIMESQKSMKPGLYSKGIRLDIYVKDEQGNAYDIEMQLLDTGNWIYGAVITTARWIVTRFRWGRNIVSCKNPL